jgi:pyruvate dehydrogenase E1 component
MNEKELREFRSRFDIPISDEEIADAPFYRPPEESPETQYLLNRRKVLHGFLPKRETKAPPLNVPGLNEMNDFLAGSGETEVSSTMAFVRQGTAEGSDW